MRRRQLLRSPGAFGSLSAVGRRLAGCAIALTALLAPASPGRAQASAPSASAPSAAAAPAAAAPAPPARAGGLVVPANTTSESIVVLRGPVDVYGTVAGDVTVVAGDLTIHPGARVTGDAVAVVGTVRNLGGRIDGAAQSLASEAGPRRGARTADATARAAPSTGSALALALGWFAILLVIGMGVLVAASPYLDGVAETLEAGVLRSLLVGFVGQLLVLPALLLVIVGLAITVLGVLAIPLAVVAFWLGLAGLVTLGFLAVAFVTGRSLGGGAGARWRAAAARGDAVRALTLGLTLYLVLWIAAAALTPVPTAALLLRAAALAVTWVACTAGFGAAILSRAGTRQPSPTAARREATGVIPVEHGGVPVWQTPTPISGIVAARRPTAGAAPPLE